MDSEPKHILWQRHIDGWLHSQLPQREYCERHNISYARFGYWRTRLKRTAQPKKKLLPVTIARPSSSISIFLSGGIRLEVAAHELVTVLPVIVQSARESF